MRATLNGERHSIQPTIDLPAQTSAATVTQRRALLGAMTDFAMVDVIDRRALAAGWEGQGPVLIDQYDTTTVVLPGQHVRVDDLGNLIVAIGSS